MGGRRCNSDTADGQRKWPVFSEPKPGKWQFEHFQAELLSASEYYPFGMEMPGRIASSESYRYGFQGQEKDDEIKGPGNSINYRFRMHDPRMGRFFSLDPLMAAFPWSSPYAFSWNRTIDHFELEGAEGRTSRYGRRGRKGRVMFDPAAPETVGTAENNQQLARDLYEAFTGKRLQHPSLRLLNEARYQQALRNRGRNERITDVFQREGTINQETDITVRMEAMIQWQRQNNISQARINQAIREESLIIKNPAWRQSESNSRTLRENLSLFNSNFDAHHIVAGNSPFARSARGILTNYQIDVNSALNGVVAVGGSGAPQTVFPRHHRGSGLHTREGQQQVFERLNRAVEGAENWRSARQSVIFELEAIRQDIYRGEFPVSSGGNGSGTTNQ